jgi:anti-sigma B factor antagonist
VAESNAVRLEEITPPKAAKTVHVATVELPTLMDGQGLEEVQKGLSDLVKERPGLDLLVDLGNVQFLSSAAIGMLGMLHRKTWGAKGRMKICSIRPEVMQVLKLTRLDSLFDIQASRDEALAQF